MQCANKKWFVVEVVYIHATGGEKLRVLFPEYAITKNASNHKISYRSV
jgi:hypothetical protein